MAYAFNEDRSKVDVYTADQIDEMDLVNDQALAQEVADRAAGDENEALARQAGDENEALARQAGDENEALARQAGYNALSGRMDTFTALSEGSTTGDAELIDARDDIYGYSYTNAGGHVRSVSNKVEDVNDALSSGYRKLRIGFSEGTIDNTTGADSANANYVRSNPIPINQIRGGYATHPGKYLYMYFYDANMTYLSRDSHFNAKATYFPFDYTSDEPNAEFVRFVINDPTASVLSLYQYCDMPSKFKLLGQETSLIETNLDEGGWVKLPTSYVQGSLSNGAVSFSFSRSTSDFIDISKYDNVKLEVKTGYIAIINIYDEDKIYKTHFEWQTGPIVQIKNIADFAYIRFTIRAVDESEYVLPPFVSDSMVEIFGIKVSTEEKISKIDSRFYTPGIRTLTLDEVIAAEISPTTGNFVYRGTGLYACTVDAYETKDFYSVENTTSDHNVYVYYYDNPDHTGFRKYALLGPGQHHPVSETNGKYFQILVYKSGGTTFDDATMSKILLVKRGYDYIPDYWKSHLDTRISEIKGHRDVAGMNGDTFAFITDTHWFENYRRSNSLLREIKKRTGITKTFFGGDIIEGIRSTKAEAKQLIDDFNIDFDYDFFGTIGNHDFNGYDASAGFSMSEVYSTQVKFIEDKVNTNGNMYYFVDNESQKIRYYVLVNAVPDDGYHIGSDQIQFLNETAGNLSSDWTIVIITHVYFDGWDSVNNIPVEAGIAQYVKNAIDTVLAMQCRLACVIIGHCHYDYSTTYNGVNIIATQCDAPEPMHIGAAMTNGTTSEQCFDIVTIDKTAGKIYLDRIGAGSSRSFDY